MSRSGGRAADVAGDDVWSLIHAGRRALADDLSELAVGRWTTASLCADWTVLQVLGHLTSEAKMTRRGSCARSWLPDSEFNTLFNREIATKTRTGPVSTLAEFRAHLNDTTSPPGPKDTWLGEVLIHAEDIRRPLGIRRDYDPAALRRIVAFHSNSNAVGQTKKRIAGLRLQASDLDWFTGDGPLVTGPALSLALVLTGRAVAFTELEGAGLPTLRSRTP